MSHLSSTPLIARAILLAGVLLAILALLSPSHFPAYAQGIEMDEIEDYPENGTHTVAAYTAMDPEGEEIAWSLDGTDAADFDIQGGVLTFNSPPDYEDPTDRDTGDSPASDNIYDVTVVAADSDTGGMMRTVTVTVTVTDVEEPGTVTLTALQPKVGFPLTAALTDPDGQPGAGPGTVLTAEGTTTWQWARSSSVDGPWEDIKEAEETDETPAITSDTLTYTPGPDDVDKYLRATAKYTDGHSPTDTPATDPDKTAQAVSAHAVQAKDYEPSAPVFPDQDPDEEDVDRNQTREVAENSTPGTAVGPPVTATDIGEDDSQEVLTYTMADATPNSGDAALFTINSQTGQITVDAGTTLDHETDPTYTVTVTAADPTDRTNALSRATITVTINVTDVDEDPTIDPDDDLSIPYDENNDAVVASQTATDPEDDNEDLIWSLSGADRSKFDISDAGALTFTSPPNYESRADSGRNNVYNVTVVVTDSGGNTDSRDVTVSIRDVEETGTVVLVFDRWSDTPMLQPEVGTRIEAILTDDDGPSRTSWQWQQGTTNIDGATSATYTPVADDDRQTLRVIATYDDGFDDGNTAQEAASNPTKADDPGNDPPEFSDQDPLTITENTNTDSDVSVGLAVTAVDLSTNEDDTSDDTLSYTLGGRDAGVFTIDETTGQISVKAGTVLDHETKPTYSVSVTATDPSAARDTVTVTINVDDMEEDPSITERGATINYPEIKNSRPNTDSVFTYTATDPEDDNARPRLPLTWSLSEVDDYALFEISDRGVLTFKSPRDYEDAADTGANNIYDVTVKVTDSDTARDEWDVEVTVTNVEEPGTVTLSELQPKEGFDLTATHTDPDGSVTGLAWRWAISSSSNGPWTNIDEAVADRDENYTPDEDDVGSYLRATATYTDNAANPEDNLRTANVNESKDVAASVSVNPVVKADYSNTDPIFPDQDPKMAGEQTAQTRKIPENLMPGTAVGDPVTAKDLDERDMQQVLIYALDGTDASSFTIDRRTGQVKVGAGTMLNYETKDTYTVTVMATDPSGLNDSITVTINVTDVKEAPELNGATADDDPVAESDHPELSSTPTTQTPEYSADVATYTATDDEDNNVDLTWSLSGADMDKFEISTSGALTFKESESPNFEAPTDAGRNNVYNVTVEVTDSDEMTASQDVAVTVTNVDEDGTVTLSNLQPEDGTQIRATLTDPDGGETSVKWQWSYGTSNSPGATFTDIAGATSATYTPTTPNADEDHYLRATATYTDNAMNPKDDPDTPPSGQSPDCADDDESVDCAFVVSANDVQAHDDANEPPEFPDQDNIASGRQTDQTREVEENSTSGTAVGLPVVAIDEEDLNTQGVPGRCDALTYTLGGPDKDFFTITGTAEITCADTDNTSFMGGTGLISVGEGTKLDYETKKTYTVTVTATDPSLASDTITVTIKVTDMNEKPVIMESGLGITGDNNIDHNEDDTSDVATYTAAGQATAGATWSLEGDDAGDFSISSSGVLTFRSTPDFENPTDQGANNVYNVMVKATSGAIEASLPVTVTVGNLEEDGTVTLSSVQNQVKVDVTITAVVTDIDVVTPNTVTWQWASSENAIGPYTNIPGATAEAYTPAEADVGNYLQATASYEDGHGPNKSESAATATAVLALTPDVMGDNGVVTLSPAQPVVGEAVTATLADPDIPVSGTTWQWARASSATASGTPITGATSASYTPVQADVGSYLQATASYNDAQGPGQSASAATANAVNAATTTPINRFDSNRDGSIQRDEVIGAIRAFLFDKTATRAEVIEVIRLHLF